jgi:hypothetical protein
MVYLPMGTSSILNNPSTSDVIPVTNTESAYTAMAAPVRMALESLSLTVPRRVWVYSWETAHWHEAAKKNRIMVFFIDKLCDNNVKQKMGNLKSPTTYLV